MGSAASLAGCSLEGIRAQETVKHSDRSAWSWLRSAIPCKGMVELGRTCFVTRGLVIEELEVLRRVQADPLGVDW